LIDFKSTEECGTNFGCFTFPSNCRNTECDLIYKWSNLNSTTHRFIIAYKLDSLVPRDSAWIAIGFSNDQAMGDDDVIICKKSSTMGDSVEHFFNSGRFTPSLLDFSEPSIGITNARVLLNEGFLICSFNREKTSARSSNYFDLNKSYFVLAAQGSLGSSGGKLIFCLLFCFVIKKIVPFYVNFRNFSTYHKSS